MQTVALPAQVTAHVVDERTLDRTVQKALGFSSGPATITSDETTSIEKPFRALGSSVKIRQLPWMTSKIPSNSKIP